MAMSLTNADGNEDQAIAAINTTPLVDVMLVLLIIFLITIPVVTHTVPVKLPAEVNQPYQSKPENINLAINRKGEMFWNQEFVPNVDVLLAKLKTVAVLKPQPEVTIRGDQETRYAFIGQAILASQRAGIAKIGFITEPPARGG
ncbi:MAG TPA: biopolymer transporter ExbD [Herbaspirillum sp.]|jgi:biopolymer transport protein ExbD